MLSPSAENTGSSEQTPGVRETAPLPFLTLVMSVEAAVALLVLLRLGDVAVDLVYFGVSRAFSKA